MRARWSRSSRTAPGARRGSPRRRSPTCASEWASVDQAPARADERTPRHRRPLPCADALRNHDAREPDAVSLATLELDLDVFSGPFDLLLTLVLREEVDLLELQLADVVLAYLDHLEQRGELDLETATEFIVLVAALLELKSRLMLSSDEQELLDIEPEQAAEELLARMLDARRSRAPATHLGELLAGEQGVRFRAAPPPPSLRRTIIHAADGSAAPRRPRPPRSCSARRPGGCC